MKPYLVIKEGNKYKRELQLGEEFPLNQNTVTAEAKNLKKAKAIYQILQTMKNKPPRG